MMSQISSTAKPTAGQIAISLLLAFAILLIVYGSAIFDKLASAFSLTSLPPTQSGLLLKLSNLSFAGLVVEILFWAIVGLAAYVCFLVVANVLGEARNEVILATAYTNKGSLAKMASNVGVEVISGVLLCALFLLSALLTVPLFLRLFAALVYSLPHPTALAELDAAGAVLGLGINIIVLWMASRVTFLLQ